jgi:hypothetical protein
MSNLFGLFYDVFLEVLCPSSLVKVATHYTSFTAQGGRVEPISYSNHKN